MVIRKKPIQEKVVKRRRDVELAIFVDGVGLDRACRRLKQKIDWQRLVNSLSIGKSLAMARYYNMLPRIDDSRQISFIDALSRAGFHTIIKRLPPKGVEHYSSIDTEIASDMMAFALNVTRYPDVYTDKVRLFYPFEDTIPVVKPAKPVIPASVDLVEQQSATDEPMEVPNNGNSIPAKREKSVVLVCPSKELDYPVAFLNSLGINTVTADFGNFSSGKILNSSQDWIDLSDSSQIWV